MTIVPVGEIVKNAVCGLWHMWNFYGRLSDERSMFTLHGQIYCLSLYAIKPCFPELKN